jgi:hypothetical protein
MRIRGIVFLAILYAIPVYSQQVVECRDLGPTGSYVAPNETIINGKACRPAGTPLQAIDPAQPTVASASIKLHAIPKPTFVPFATPASPVAVPETPSDPLPTKEASGSAELSLTSSTSTPLTTRIMPGSTVYIVPMDGFDTYLAAALQKKKVPLIAVGNENQATYIIKGTSDEKKAGWAKMIFMGDMHSDNAASIQMFDRKSSAIVFAYAVNKKSTLHGQQTTAEACAKHLKEQIEKE